MLKLLNRTKEETPVVEVAPAVEVRISEESDFYKSIVAAKARIIEIKAFLDSTAYRVSGSVKDKLKNERDELDNFVYYGEKVIAAGYSEGTPPRDWYMGYLEAPDRDRYGNNLISNAGWVSGLNTYSGYSNGAVFTSPIPVEHWNAYKKAKNIFGPHIRIYSPNAADFEELPKPRVMDPVIFGRLYDPHNKKSYFFEIARWDTTKDLAVMFGDK